MPLKEGTSDETVSANIRMLLDEYSKTGKIGNSRPANKTEARKQAVAIALSNAGQSRKK